jgi:hypothetical protein
LVQQAYTQILKNVKVLFHGKFVNYILEANEENYDILQPNFPRLNQKITEMSVVSPWHCYKKLFLTSHACMMQSTPNSEAKNHAHEH